MPRRPPRPCSHPGCGILTRQGKCAKHKGQADRDRGSASSRGYGAAWQRARQLYLMTEPLCRECARQGITKPATDVDHIRPHKGDAGLFWDQGNWQPLCHSCHSAKTHRETSNN